MASRLRRHARALVVTGAALLFLTASVRSQEPPVRHSFNFRNEALRTALDSLIRWYGASIVFLEHDVAGRWVSTGCVDCTADKALSSVLSGQGLRATKVGEQIVIRPGWVDRGSGMLAGTVVDSLTGEPLSGAIVVLRSTEDESSFRWGMTGASGFFSLRDIAAGPYVIQVRRVGYETHRTTMTIGEDSEPVRDFTLPSRELTQPQVTVEGRRSAFSAAEGISRGVFIRSAPSDQHQYFLEGARVYHPVHAGGLTSAFHGDALRDVQTVAGGLPPYYGGRIGGVMDLSLRPGSRESLHGSAEVGTLGSGVVLDGPVTDATTFVLSGRLQYPDLLSAFSYPKLAASDQHAGELLFKVEQALQDRQTLSVSAFVSRDALDRVVSAGPAWRLDNALRWQNAAASVRWNGMADPALLFSGSAAWSAYGFSTDHLMTNGGVATARRRSTASVQDLALRAHAEYFYDRYHTVLGGLEIIRHELSGTIDPFTSQLISTPLGGSPPWELSVYLQDQWLLAPSVVAELGARATSFIASNGATSSVDPRFSLMLLLDDSRRITGSVSSVTQYLHPYRHSGLFLFYPSIFFYPTGDGVPPQTSLHGTVGYEQYLRDERYRVAVETYGRVTRNLHEFASDSARSGPASVADALLLGEGTSVGAEFTVDKRNGDIIGTVRYGFSWTTHRFDGLNGGRPFQPRFDRRHELFVAVTYALSPSWTLGGVALISSNHVPLVTGGANDARAAGPETGMNTGADARYAEPFDLNGGRLPGFQRLELRMSYAFRLFDRSVESTVRLLNGYGLVDPFRWKLMSSADPRAQWSITYDPPPLLPLYPSLQVRVLF